MRVANYAQIEKIVSDVLVEMLGWDTATVSDHNKKIVEDLGADSIDLVEIVIALEDEFGIAISDEEAEKLTTVGETVNYVNGVINKSSVPST